MPYQVGASHGCFQMPRTTYVCKVAGPAESYVILIYIAYRGASYGIYPVPLLDLSMHVE